MSSGFEMLNAQLATFCEMCQKESPGGIDPTGADSSLMNTDCLAKLVLICNRFICCQSANDTISWVCSDAPAKMKCLEAQRQRFSQGLSRAADQSGKSIPSRSLGSSLTQIVTAGLFRSTARRLIRAEGKPGHTNPIYNAARPIFRSL